MQNNYLIYRVVLTVVLLLIQYASFSQNVEQFTKQEGLPSNVVYQVFQSESGHIWMLTELGVVKFNGKEVIVYNEKNALNGNEHFEVIPYYQQLLLLGANGRLSSIGDATISTRFARFISHAAVLGRENIIFSSFGDGIHWKNANTTDTIKKQHGLPDNYVSFIWQWNGEAYTISKKGISRISKNNKEVTIQREVTFQKPIHFSRAYKDSNKVLFTNNKELCIYHKSGSLRYIKGGASLTSKYINRISKIGEEYTASTYKGIYFFKIVNDSIRVTDSLMNDTPCSSIIKDHEGAYWVSSLTSGVYRIKKGNFNCISKKEPFFSISAENNESIYTGLLDNTLQIWKNGESNKVQLSPKNKYNSQKVYRIKEKGDSLWLNTDGGLVIYNQKNKQVNRYRTGVGVVLELDSGIIIGNQVGCYKLKNRKDLEKLKDPDGFLVGDVGQTILSEEVNVIRIWRHQLYIGTSKGLYLYNLKENKLRETALPKEEITAIYIDEERCVVGYEEEGVYLMTEKDTLSMNALNGISANFIKQLRVIKGVLLVCTSNGVNTIPLNTIRKDQYDNEVYLSNITVNDIVYFREFYYAATGEGVYRADNLTKKRVEYTIPIEQISVYNGDHQLEAAELRNLEYYDNNIKVDFNVIHFDKDVQKQYRLNDGSWRGFEGALMFNKMAPGYYELSLRAIGKSGKSVVYQTGFTIHPPWWRTWWFRLGSLAAIALLIYWFFKVRILTYNRDIIREMMHIILERLKKEKSIIVNDIRDGSKTKIVLSKLLYVEASRNYTTFFTTTGKVTSRGTLKECHKRLNQEKKLFVRCHRSYIVNAQKISAIHGDFLKINETKIPVGKTYLENAKAKIDLLNKN